MSTILDTDILKEPIEGVDYQLVYGLFYIYASYEDEEVDLYLNNHIVRLCKSFPTKVLQTAKVKRWLRLLNCIYGNLMTFENSTLVHIPHCNHYQHPISETKEQFLLVISILEDYLKANFSNMEYIDGLDNELEIIPSLGEMFEWFCKSCKRSCDRFFESFLRNELMSFFCIELKENGGCEYKMNNDIYSHLGIMYNGFKNKLYEEKLRESVESHLGEVLNNKDSFIKSMIFFYVKNILLDDCKAKLLGLEHSFNYEDIIKEEMYRRRLLSDESAKTEWYEENMYHKVFGSDVEVCIPLENETESDEEPEEIRYKGYFKKRIGTLYYMLHDALKNDELLTKVANYVLNQDYKPGSKNGNTAYKYINNIGSEVLNSYDRVDYIIEQLSRYEIPIPDEVIKNARKK